MAIHDLRLRWQGKTFFYLSWWTTIIFTNAADRKP